MERRITLVYTALAVTALVGSAVGAQSTDRLQLKIGIGTFLSRDRGWNYSEPVEFLAALVRRSGSVDLEAGATFSKSFTGFSRPAVSPPPPTAFRDGIRAHFGVRAPTSGQHPITALIGTELVINRTEHESRAPTLAGLVGIGVNFGPAHRASVDLKYIGFARSLGSSRGILPLSASWRF